MTTFTTGDISPEHTARATNNDLHPEVDAAYAYVDRVLHTADHRSAFNGAPAWHGWALREAFLAGCSHAAALAQPEPQGPTDEEPTDQEIEEWADAAAEVPLEEMDPEVHGWRRCFKSDEFSETIRAALRRWGRSAIKSVPQEEG